MSDPIAVAGADDNPPPTGDTRFTLGLITDVLAVLDAHGYVRGGPAATGAAVGTLARLVADYEGTAAQHAEDGEQ
ncbi:hypothetical protein [Streptomonospora wellingtoniae]|uniref:Uncharacterized protein n=1 Tax=Streptomonospora wellingtoniae TaxID=3075544 RepID=A0ABU2L0I8_9ACTN|nr:hypothetical protein [Streptomonospora sp. DSM 45055]MDT0305040.1 hypothetical protein [Streptomonospora sp. DSM 45055]